MDAWLSNAPSRATPSSLSVATHKADTPCPEEDSVASRTELPKDHGDDPSNHCIAAELLVSP
jgi:hypothetical protein